MAEENGLVQIYYGDGKGKTTDWPSGVRAGGGGW